MANTAGSKKAKGKRLEIDVAKSLRDAGLDPDAKRMVLSGAAYGFESDIWTNLPIKIECKNQETWSPMEFYEQAKEAAGTTDIPIVVMSRNRMPEPMALLSWNDLIAIMQYAVKGGWTPELPFSKRKQVGK